MLSPADLDMHHDVRQVWPHIGCIRLFAIGQESTLLASSVPVADLRRITLSPIVIGDALIMVENPMPAT